MGYDKRADIHEALLSVATRKSSKTFENWPVHDCYTRLGRNAIRAGCYSTRCPE